MNKFGRTLLELCQATGLSILNGRVQGDVPARFTSHCNAGYSVIDYFIASADICQRTVRLEVHGILASSDHYPVQLTLDMPTLPPALPCHVPQTTTLKYDSSRTDAFNAQFMNSEGVSLCWTASYVTCRVCLQRRVSSAFKTAL